jgi:hypothetical protein
VYPIFKASPSAVRFPRTFAVVTTPAPPHCGHRAPCPHHRCSCCNAHGDAASQISTHTSSSSNANIDNNNQLRLDAVLGEGWDADSCIRPAAVQVHTLQSSVDGKVVTAADVAVTRAMSLPADLLAALRDALANMGYHLQQRPQHVYVGSGGLGKYTPIWLSAVYCIS